MNRREMLKGVGGVGVAGVSVFFANACTGVTAVTSSDNSAVDMDADGACVLIPQETAGPFPLNLSTNQDYFRQDITEGKTGQPLNLKLKVVNINDGCAPISQARVDVWHCDADGVYSGYANQNGGVNAQGQTFCRGIQLSDANGEVSFLTIYPGWYPGRATHIHFQVYLNNGLIATSQLAFPEEINQVVHQTGVYTSQGQNPTKNTDDGIFRSPADALQYQLATTTQNTTTGGYDAFLKVGIAV